MPNELLSITNSWLSLAIPHLGPIGDTIGFVQSLSDKLLFDKLYYVLSRQDSDFEEWLKISENFDSDSKNYNKMVQQLIYYINAINEVDLLQAYANLLSAYKCKLICKSDFFRLGFCLTKLLAEDAQFLSKNIHRERIEENLYCLSLSSNNLMYNMSRGFSATEEDSGKEYYCFTEVGKMLDKYALSFGDEEKYSYREIDAQLSEQKLTYTHMQQAEWLEF